MTKRYMLLPYRLYFLSWRGLAAVLFVLSVVLLVVEPSVANPYRGMLILSAGLGLIVFVLGLAMAVLAFVAVGQDAIAIQLPLWRVRVPLDSVRSARLVTLDKAAPGRFKDIDLAEMSAVMLEVTRWPQAERVMRFWLGRFVLPGELLLPVDDVIGLRRAIDTGLQGLKESRKVVLADEPPGPLS